MSYQVYILQSQKNGDLYVGSTADLETRISLHNRGRVKSTKAYRPWVLLESRVYSSRGETVAAERFLKTGQQKEILRRKYRQARWPSS
ncbi:GIY-YIG nuclease family protein [Candidatus Parcubacteria bacterium]|nr:GIY-YIG nuclease family protein [Candidatus Parcubacteria bacterium]